VPGIIRVGRTNDHLQIRKLLPNARDRFDSVPAGRHAYVNEGDRIWFPAGGRRADFFQSFLALEGGAYLKGPWARRVRCFPKESRFVRFKACGELSIRRVQDFPEVFMNRRIVVDDENASILRN